MEYKILKGNATGIGSETLERNVNAAAADGYTVSKVSATNSVCVIVMERRRDPLVDRTGAAEAAATA